MVDNKISEVSVLALPSLQRSFEDGTNASQYAMGAVLMQEGRPIEYHSEMFSWVVQNYPTYDKKFYALYQAIKR
ncbi:hypothetical protein V2J09_000748 [Rumex salicifolius]